MARKLTMTWVASRKGWIAKYKGKMYSVSCRQLGVEPTKESSWRAAREWWAAKKAEIDARPKPVDERVRVGHAMWAAWIVQEYRDKPLPRELAQEIVGKARLHELEEGVRALVARPKLERTIGANVESWNRTLRAAVDAGRIDISRYDAYRRNLAVFAEWAGPGS